MPKLRRKRQVFTQAYIYNGAIRKLKRNQQPRNNQLVRRSSPVSLAISDNNVMAIDASTTDVVIVRLVVTTTMPRYFLPIRLKPALNVFR